MEFFIIAKLKKKEINNQKAIINIMAEKKNLQHLG